MMDPTTILTLMNATVAQVPEAAIEAYERYLEYPFFDGGEALLHLFATNVHERLGPLYEQVGNPEKAVEHYLRFADLWRTADPELMDRVERALARADALGRLDPRPRKDAL